MDFVVIREPAKDVNVPADPGPLWLDRRDCAAIKPASNRNKPGNRYGALPLTAAMRRSLRWRRKAAELTQLEAAEFVGHTKQWLLEVEQGRINTIHPDVYQELLDFYADRFAELEAEAA